MELLRLVRGRGGEGRLVDGDSNAIATWRQPAKRYPTPRTLNRYIRGVVWGYGNLPARSSRHRNAK